MKYEILRTEITDNIGVVTISRPKALNALNSAFFKEMDHFLDTLDPNIKVLILTGEGKAFVAGADIAEMSDMSSAEGTEFSKIGQKTFGNDIFQFRNF